MAKKKRNALNVTGADILNDRTYLMYLCILQDICISTIKWEGLPETIDPRFLEWVLMTDGRACFFEDEIAGYLCLQMRNNGQFDHYRNPTTVVAYAPNGYYRELERGEYIPIYNNYTRTNEINNIEMYAARLYEIERTIDVNVKNQKTPKLITGEESQILTLKNIYNKYEGNHPAIFADKQINFSTLHVLDTSSPYVSDKLQMLKRQIWNEALTHYGVNNNISEKKERMVSAEANSNIEGVEAYRGTRIAAREDAATGINRLFNLNISVGFKQNNAYTENALDNDQNRGEF